MAHPGRGMTSWERNLLGVRADQAHLLLPGLAMAGVLAWLSIWLSDVIGVQLMGFENSPVSAVIVVLLLGLGIGNLLPLPTWLEPGLTFSVKKVLRLGIILLGIRLSVFDVFRLGAMGVPIVFLCIVGALVLTTLLNRWLKLPERLGTLIAVGTSICGVSAIVAAGPAIDASDEEISYAVAVITVFGIAATFLYPALAHAIFAGDAVKAGLFLGTSIHETAQVTGAGMVFADMYRLPLGLDVATITKMVRNVFMAFVIPFMALTYGRRMSEQGETVKRKASIAKLFPLFIAGFLAFALLRSVGDTGINAGGHAFGLWDAAAWKAIYGTIKEWASVLLVVALAGVGLKTRFATIRGLGIKPFIVGLGAALVVGGLSIATISVLGTFVSF